MARGALGLALVSIAAFVPWMLAGAWKYDNELAMYGSCAAIFIVFSGLALHRLAIGPESLKRFCVFFSVAFLAYAVAWTAGWMGLRGQHTHLRSAVGLIAGALTMGALIAGVFDAWGALARIVAVLLALNAAGYFLGDAIEGVLLRAKEVPLPGFTLSGAALLLAMKVLWGVCFGLGLGAGLGYAFHAAQEKARGLIAGERG
jgi:hypothetical protein